MYGESRSNEDFRPSRACSQRARNASHPSCLLEREDVSCDMLRGASYIGADLAETRQGGCRSSTKNSSGEPWLPIRMYSDTHYYIPTAHAITRGDSDKAKTKGVVNAVLPVITPPLMRRSRHTFVARVKGVFRRIMDGIQAAWEHRDPVRSGRI
jgi:hypothetical protein